MRYVVAKELDSWLVRDLRSGVIALRAGRKKCKLQACRLNAQNKEAKRLRVVDIEALNRAQFAVEVSASDTAKLLGLRKLKKSDYDLIGLPKDVALRKWEWRRLHPADGGSIKKRRNQLPAMPEGFNPQMFAGLAKLVS